MYNRSPTKLLIISCKIAKCARNTPSSVEFSGSFLLRSKTIISRVPKLHTNCFYYILAFGYSWKFMSSQNPIETGAGRQGFRVWLEVFQLGPSIHTWFRFIPSQKSFPSPFQQAILLVLLSQAVLAVPRGKRKTSNDSFVSLSSRFVQHVAIQSHCFLLLLLAEKEVDGLASLVEMNLAETDLPCFVWLGFQMAYPWIFVKVPLGRNDSLAVSS